MFEDKYKYTKELFEDIFKRNKSNAFEGKKVTANKCK